MITNPCPVLSTASDEGVVRSAVELSSQQSRYGRGASLFSYILMAFITKILPFSPSPNLTVCVYTGTARSTAVYQCLQRILPFWTDQHRVHSP